MYFNVLLLNVHGKHNLTILDFKHPRNRNKYNYCYVCSDFKKYSLLTFTSSFLREVLKKRQTHPKFEPAELENDGHFYESTLLIKMP